MVRELHRLTLIRFAEVHNELVTRLARWLTCLIPFDEADHWLNLLPRDEHVAMTEY